MTKKELKAHQRAWLDHNASMCNFGETWLGWRCKHPGCHRVFILKSNLPWKMGHHYEEHQFKENRR